MYYFDAETLKPLWTYETSGAIIGAPAYDNGKVYFEQFMDIFSILI